MKPMNHDTLTNGAETVARPLIVHVVRQFLPNRGGLEDVVYNLCMQSLNRGYRIRVVTLNSLFSDPSLVLKDREIIDGMEVVRIPWRGSSRYPVAPWVLKYIGDADIVHVHAIDFFFDFLALTRPWHRKRMIATTHGGFFHTKRFAAIKDIWFQTMSRFSASQYAALIGCSRSDFETFSQIAQTKVRMIENGTDTGKFVRAASPTPQKRIVTLGRFSVNKRLDRLIEMMAALTRRDPEWQLEILGVPSDLTVADLHRLMAENGVTGHVRIQIGLSNTEIREVMGRSSFFASASEYEGFGLVAIEAMSAGLVPVLEQNDAYQALAAKHPLLNLTQFTNPEMAASAIQSAHSRLVQSGDDLRARLRGESEAYSWDRAADKYIEIYDEIMVR